MPIPNKEKSCTVSVTCLLVRSLQICIITAPLQRLCFQHTTRTSIFTPAISFKTQDFSSTGLRELKEFYIKLYEEI
jgi:hypothetical protein